MKMITLEDVTTKGNITDIENTIKTVRKGQFFCIYCILVSLNTEPTALMSE